jgi:LmbE family N-acetylglucosaminyl deacetylase
MFSGVRSEVFVPDGEAQAPALSRTTHLGIGAHADDLEIMAIHGIVACYDDEARWFTGAVVTDGAGSPQDPAQALSPSALADQRRAEQKRAATIGRYGAQVFLDHSSATLKDPRDPTVSGDLVLLLRVTRPEVVYTHALTDSHDTHVALALRVIDACRKLAPGERPVRVLGCEVWRDLDWLSPEDKVALPIDGHEALQQRLLSAFTSQVAAKRYDLGALGRRRANAVFSEARAVDRHRGIVWAMDLSSLVHHEGGPEELVRALMERFQKDVVERLTRLRPVHS